MSSVGDRGSAARAWSAWGVLLLAVACGLATGLGETLALHLRRVLSDRIIFLSRHDLWMRPVAEALLFGTVAISLWAAARWAEAPARLRTVAFALLFLAAASPLWHLPRLHPVARIVLAGGIAYQGSGLLVRHAGLVRRALPRVSAAVVALVAVPSLVTSVVTAPSADAAPGVATANAPDLLLLVLDTVRAESLELYGYDRPTSPTLVALAAEGIRFDRAIAPSPWTLPSHASMFTGRHPHGLSADWRRPLDEAEPTVAEYLGRHGYRTAGFVANMGYCGWETGLDRGFAHYEDQPASLRQLVVSSTLVRAVITHPGVRTLVGSDENFVRKSAGDVNGAFLRWLDDGPTSRPYFAFLNYYDAHAPYMPPEPYRSRLATGDPRGGISPLHRWSADPFSPPPGAEDVAREREAYEGAIAYIDAEIGRLIDALRERGRLGRTVIVVTSDHGEEFGEHGLFDHGNSLYMDGLHVPLVIRLPTGAAAGEVVRRPVSLRSLAATLSDLAGLSPSPFPGPSLREAWEGPWGEADRGKPPEHAPVLSEVSRASGLPDWFPVSRGDMRSIVLGDWHYIRHEDGAEQLYETRMDPEERRDLVGDPGARERLHSLRAALEPFGPDGP